MPKSKIFKTDGTEDFDAESKQLDDAAAPGLIADESNGSSDAGKNSSSNASTSSSSVASNAVSSDQGKPDAGSVDESSSTSASQEASPTSAVDVSGPKSTITTNTSDTSSSTLPDAKESAKPSEPEPFGDLHGAVSELGDVLEQDALNALKDAGNKATPALNKLHGVESKIEKLGDEIKARFTHAKQQLVNAVASLEMLFKRGK